MIGFHCEEPFISHLLSLNSYNYSMGLFAEEELSIEGERLLSTHINNNGLYDRFEYNLKTNVFKMSKKKNEKNEFVSIAISDIESNCIVDISNNGLRWEGSCLNHSPFGYGSLYNNSNELIYRGIMIGNSKECFGIDFYPGFDLIEYIGCYNNNKRHGFGMLYDRKGELIYEGDWLCGSKDYEKNENVILKDLDHSRIVNSLIHELVIGEGCGVSYKGDLRLCGFVNLERIVVKNNSFVNVNSLEISDNSELKSIEIEEHCFNRHVVDLMSKMFSSIIDY